MKEAIRSQIEGFVSAHQVEYDREPIWRRPLVGFASALDPLFATLQSAVSPTHAMPTDLLDQAATVVAFFIPFSKALGASNTTGQLASRQWALAYIQTNQLIRDIGDCLKTFLEGQGFSTRIFPATHNFSPEKLLSDWSHRHVAFIAGLGKFGVNNMLITESGCCGRVGSFITTALIEPDPRSEEEACLARRGEPCLRCVARCVNQALRADGFDRHRCNEMCMSNEMSFESLGKADVCGKCDVGIPCAFWNPVKAKPYPSNMPPEGQ